MEIIMLPIDVKYMIGSNDEKSEALSLFSMEELVELAINKGMDPRQMLYNSIKDAETRIENEKRMNMLALGNVGKIVEILHTHAGEWEIEVYTEAKDSDETQKYEDILKFIPWGADTAKNMASILRELYPNNEIEMQGSTIYFPIDGVRQLFNDIGQYYDRKYPRVSVVTDINRHYNPMHGFYRS